MPHVITGQIRKEPFTREGNGNNGAWKMYSFDLSERYKNKDGNMQYTNYRVVFFGNDKTRQWYDEAFQAGSVVSVSCDALAPSYREHEGKIYIQLEPQRPQLVFNQSQQGGQQQPSSGNQRPQQQQQSRPQQQQQRPQQQQQQNPPMDFDDDIPF